MARASVLLLALAALGCEARVSLGDRCRDEGECPGAPVCRFGRCRAECARASDCAESGAICIGEAGRGVCTAPATDTCTASCTDGLVCVGETCGLPCTAAGTECLPGSSCGVDAVCVADASSDAGARDASAADGGLSDAGSGGDTAHHLVCNGFDVVCMVARGQVYCWGNNHNDQLADGVSDHGALCPLTGDRYDCASAPERPVLDDATGTPLGDVISIGCGEAYACALTGDGRVLCWGQPGPHIGVVSPAAPRALEAIAGGATELTVGWGHACARMSTGPHCWGLNGQAGGIDGRLGRTDAPLQETPTEAPVLADLDRLSAGRVATCGVASNGTVRCAGEGATQGVADPAGRTIEGATDVTVVTTGRAHACALAAEGLVCWGSNASRQLGMGSGGPDCADMSCRRAAAPVDGSVGITFRALSHGSSDHTCAIDDDGHVRCWGYQPCGDAGADTMGGSQDAVLVLGPPIMRADGPVLDDVVEVTVGGSTCARTASGEVLCWGNNNYGQLGFLETASPAPGCLSLIYPTAHSIPTPPP